MLVMTNYVYPPLSMMNIDLERTLFVKCTDILGDKMFSEYRILHATPRFCHDLHYYYLHET